MNPPAIRYTEAESEAAHKQWKASCGPHSIAAAMSLKLEDIRQAMLTAGISYKGWMSPTYVSRTLDTLGAKYDLAKGLKTMSLCEGINRIQWEGPWLKPGVHPRIAYFHTHLVAAFGEMVLCTCCENAKWIDHAEWRVFHLTEEPKSPFHITHHWRLTP